VACSAYLQGQAVKEAIMAKPQKQFSTPILAVVAAVAFGVPSAVLAADFTFTAIEGGNIDLADWRGHPVLVVNTASLCGYTPQYEDLQALQDTYGARGLKVLAVPSNDFAQELDSDTEVKAFCDANFGLTLPMTTITPVTGGAAHPFYAWVKGQTGFEPDWNFNKVLLNGEGAVVATWGSGPKPTGGAITKQIEALLQ
jgi:glutathione peroxidase